MSFSVATLSVLIAASAIGQDTVPDPARGTNPQNHQPQQNLGAIDRFFPNQSGNQGGNQTNDPLTEALGTNIPTSVRTALDQLRAHHLGERLWFYLKDEGASYGDSIYLLPDNRILRLAPLPSDLRIYTYNTTQNNWTEIGTRTNDPTNPHTNPQISAAIKDILESRRTRPWVSPVIRGRLTALNGTLYPDGTLRYAGSESPYSSRIHGDSLYVMPNGDVISVDPLNGGIFRYNGSTWSATGYNANRRNELSEELRPAVTAILASRQQRGWLTPYPMLYALRPFSHNTDGTFNIGHPINEAHGNLAYVLDNGSLLFVSSNGQRIFVVSYSAQDRDTLTQYPSEYFTVHSRNLVVTEYNGVNDNAIPQNLRESIRRGTELISARRR